MKRILQLWECCSYEKAYEVMKKLCGHERIVKSFAVIDKGGSEMDPLFRICLESLELFVCLN